VHRAGGINATPEEKSDLSGWVRSGHSPYENGDFIATESGVPMDFINARRFLEDEYREYLKNPQAYRGFPEQAESVSDGPNLNGDLPF